MPRRSLIDIDEFGLHLNAAGSSLRGLKICKPGNYDRGMFKLTIILAVEAGDPAVANGLVGSLTMPRVWARISDEAGMTTEEKRWSEVSDLQTMRAVIEHIIDNDISNMEETFLYCGYMELIISILCDSMPILSHTKIILNFTVMIEITVKRFE